MVKIINKKPKVNSVSEIIFPTKSDACQYYSQLDHTNSLLPPGMDDTTYGLSACPSSLATPHDPFPCLLMTN